jgi:hypothetical protein
VWHECVNALDRKKGYDGSYVIIVKSRSYSGLWFCATFLLHVIMAGGCRHSQPTKCWSPQFHVGLFFVTWSILLGYVLHLLLWCGLFVCTVSWLVPHPIVIWLTYGIYGMLCMYVCTVHRLHDCVCSESWLWNCKYLFVHGKSFCHFFFLVFTICEAW